MNGLCLRAWGGEGQGPHPGLCTLCSNFLQACYRTGDFYRVIQFRRLFAVVSTLSKPSLFPLLSEGTQISLQVLFVPWVCQIIRSRRNTIINTTYCLFVGNGEVDPNSGLYFKFPSKKRLFSNSFPVLHSLLPQQEAGTIFSII